MKLPRPRMLCTTKRFMPNGGVIWPISHSTISTTPNHSGSKPRLTTIGTISGAVVISIARVSMKQPSTI
ncbi:hypothetical protein D3C79_994590 [compost metagenome]